MLSTEERNILLPTLGDMSVVKSTTNYAKDVESKLCTDKTVSNEAHIFIFENKYHDDAKEGLFAASREVLAVLETNG